MKKQFYNKIAFLISFIFIMQLSNLYACGPSLYSDDTRFSLLSPQLIENPALLPFSYTHAKFYPNKNEQLYMDRDINIEEWVKYGNKAYQYSEVLHIQYNTSADSFLTIASNNNWSVFEENDWIKWLLEKKNSHVLDYFIYAKEVEKNMPAFDEWGEWTKDNLSKNSKWKGLIEKGLSNLKKVKKDTFIQERYAFQIIKCAYYNQYYNNDKSYNAEAIKLYEKYLKKSNSIVSGWALIYVAELHDSLQKKTETLIEAFDKSNEKKLRAFTLINFSEVEKIVKTTSNNYHKEIGTVILNLNNSGRGMEQIQTVYKLNPKSPYLKLMINREVNKLEEWIWSSQYLKFWPESFENKYYGKVDYDNPNYDWEKHYQTILEKSMNFEKWAIQNRIEDMKYLIAFRSYLTSIHKDKNIKEGYMSIVIAHLFSMNNEFKEAEKILKSMSPAQSDPIVLQYHYEKNIVMLETYDFNSQRTRDLFVMSLVEIHNKSFPKRPYRYYNDYKQEDSIYLNAKNKVWYVDGQFLVYTGHKLIEKGFRLDGALFIASSNQITNEYTYNDYNDPYSYGHISVLEKYIQPEDVDLIFTYKKKKNPNLYELFMFPTEFGDDNLYLDLKGTLYLRMKDYENALKTFEKISPDFWQTKYEFANYLPYHSISELPKYLIPGVKTGNGKVYSMVSKFEILNDIVQFKSIIDTTKNTKLKAENQLYLANAFFNISYYGDAWMTFAYGKSAYTQYETPYSYKWTHYSIPKSDVNRLDNYYELTDALTVYAELLLNPSANDEQKAIATTMLMVGQVNRNFYKNYYKDYLIDDKDYSAVQKELKQPFLMSLLKFSNTKVYKALKQSCPDV